MAKRVPKPCEYGRGHELVISSTTTRNGVFHEVYACTYQCGHTELRNPDTKKWVKK